MNAAAAQFTRPSLVPPLHPHPSNLNPPGVSGTSNPRFTSHDRPVSATPASPGPAVYQADVPQIVKRHKERGKMSSSFSTQVDRFRTRDGTGEGGMGWVGVHG